MIDEPRSETSTSLFINPTRIAEEGQMMLHVINSSEKCDEFLRSSIIVALTLYSPMSKNRIHILKVPKILARLVMAKS